MIRTTASTAPLISDGDTYLAMEFIEGVSLRQHIGAPHDVGDALGISEQIVDGLATSALQMAASPDARAPDLDKFIP